MSQEIYRRYWMHRISFEREVKKALLDSDGLLVTGWGMISYDSFLKMIRGRSRKEFDKIYHQEFGRLTRNRFCIYMFLNEFQKGDFVIVPDARYFSVYEIIGDAPLSKEHIYEYVNSDVGKKIFGYENGKYYKVGTTEELELGFFWQVKPVELDISREGYADNNLRRRLKFQMTNIQMTDLSKEIHDAIKAKKSNTPIDIRAEIIEASSRIILDKLKNKINDSGFEKVVKWYLERIGATTTDIPAKRALSSDTGDADVIALFDDIRVALFVQVKQYDNMVDKKAIEQVVNAYESYYKDLYPDRTPILWVLTTCEQFLEDAIEFANENNVRCIDGNEFARMLLDIGFKDMRI